MRPEQMRYNGKAKLITIPLKAWVASSTVRNIGGPIPDHPEPSAATSFPRYYVAKASLQSLVVPVGGGTLFVDLIVFDKSEAAEDVLVNDYDAEAIVAKQANDMTFVAETSEYLRVLYPGDGLIVDLVASGTVTTNWVQGDACVLVELMPLFVPGEAFGPAPYPAV